MPSLSKLLLQARQKAKEEAEKLQAFGVHIKRAKFLPESLSGHCPSCPAMTRLPKPRHARKQRRSASRIHGGSPSRAPPAPPHQKGLGQGTKGGTLIRHLAGNMGVI